ncbi:NUDIX domain-containing protein [Aeromicrobium halocynthiae]|uniref:NUDIX domain-containing protein n=1 Tax=Aeromicrobium halocynthiae TaxID=560557 RepID=A0ABN2VQL9_9ACTN
MSGVPIEVVAALLVDERGHALMVRKRGTTAFMQPGGKLEPGEEALDGLRRELREELALDVAADRFEPIGIFEEDAANEPGRRVRATVWQVLLHEGDAHAAAAEIEEARWIDPADPGDVVMAPLSVRALLPLLR